MFLETAYSSVNRVTNSSVSSSGGRPVTLSVMACPTLRYPQRSLASGAIDAQHKAKQTAVAAGKVDICRGMARWNGKLRSDERSLPLGHQERRQYNRNTEASFRSDLALQLRSRATTRAYPWTLDPQFSDPLTLAQARNPPGRTDSCKCYLPF
jgi:hypothetical protein